MDVEHVIAEISNQLGRLDARTEELEKCVLDLRRRTHDLADKLQPFAHIVEDIDRIEARLEELCEESRSQRIAAAERERLAKLGQRLGWVILSVGAAIVGAAVWIAERWEHLVALFKNPK